MTELQHTPEGFKPMDNIRPPLVVLDANSKSHLVTGPAPRTSILKYFTWTTQDTPVEQLKRRLMELATQVELELPDGPEKSAGLRKLLEAKDCLVRAALP